jgi:very-short-patch-repair endonuclease
LGQKEYDIQRSAYLESLGYNVMRFWNAQVINDAEGVIRSIEAALDQEDLPVPVYIQRRTVFL